MKPSRIVLLLVAILAGGLAAFLATRGGNDPVQVATPAPEIIQEARTQILVATAPIGVGERLSDKTVAWQDWPEGAVRPEYVNIAASPEALQQVNGAVARFEIFPGDPILETKLVRTEQGYLSAVLEQGKRGVSITVGAESASGGFIVPNDHVDVVLTRSGPSGQISETILENVKVLAINTRLGETGKTGAPEGSEEGDGPRSAIFAGSAIATLELDPFQSETVINAGKVGSLSLALRSIADFGGNVASTPDGSRASRSQTVRTIKFGIEGNVMAGVNTSAVSVDPAAYAAPAAAAPMVADPAPSPLPLAVPTQPAVVAPFVPSPPRAE